MVEKQKEQEEIKQQMEIEMKKMQADLLEKQKLEERISPGEGESQENKELQAQIQRMQEENERMQQEYQRSQEETKILAQEKQVVEEKQKKDREERDKMERAVQAKTELKNQFKQKIKEIERKIVEANECAKIMKKNIQFSYKIVGQMSDSLMSFNKPGDEVKIKKDEIQIQVENFDNDTVLLWSTKKFYDKLEMFKDTINTVQDSGTTEIDQEEDPFIEALQPIFLGQAYYRLEPLAFLIDNPSQVSIIGSNLQVMGKLEVNVMPIDEDGESEIAEDRIPDEPSELVGQRIDFVVEISKAIDLPDNFCKDVYCEYTFFLSEEKFATTQVIGKDINPIFDFKNHHTVEYCSENFIEYLKNDSVRLLTLIYSDSCVLSSTDTLTFRRIRRAAERRSRARSRVSTTADPLQTTLTTRKDHLKRSNSPIRCTKQSTRKKLLPARHLVSRSLMSPRTETLVILIRPKPRSRNPRITMLNLPKKTKIRIA